MWRDTADLWAGEDWRRRIRTAITKNALVFIACFSEASESRERSGQREELTLAVEQLRLRHPDQPWLIPVRFDDVEIPEYDLGAGRTLSSIQRADLIGDSWEVGAARLVGAVLRSLGRPTDVRSLPSPTESLTERVKSALREPGGDIALHDLLMPLADDVRAAISDDTAFPNSSDALNGAETDAAFFVMGLVDSYLEAIDSALDSLIVVSQWAAPQHHSSLRQFVERMAPVNADDAGMVVLTSLRWFPVVLIEYSATIAALQHENYSAIKTVLVDATIRDKFDGQLPIIARGNTWRPFSNFPLAAQLLALRASGEELTRADAELVRQRRKPNRHTPVSDFLHETLRSKFQSAVPGNDQFTDLFDTAEVLLGLIALDASEHLRRERMYFDRPVLGQYTWRGRHMQGPHAEQRLRQTFLDQGASWPPLAAGLFGGSIERANSAFDALLPLAAEARGKYL